MQKKFEYPNDEITVIWQPHLCQHSGICVKTLPQVYRPEERPWIKPFNATAEELIEQIKKCPSRALSFEYNQNKKQL